MSWMLKLDETFWTDCAVCRAARAWVLVGGIVVGLVNVGMLIKIDRSINANQCQSFQSERVSSQLP